jgi:EAL domain-containing protein (putative c-di-GMP-specific phosphodiesterase class I)
MHRPGPEGGCVHSSRAAFLPPHDDRVLVKAIVDLARGLRKRTIAEFVGSEEALELLREYGVDFAQAFHLGTPEPLPH